MKKLCVEQFIYGKFDSGLSGEYQVTGCSHGLKDVDLGSYWRGYRFWKEQPSRPEHNEAIGIFACPDFIGSNNGENYLLVVQLQYPKKKIPSGELVLRTLDRPFFQYRYLFIREKDLAAMNYRVPWLLSSLSSDAIPVQKRDSVSLLSDKVPQIDLFKIDFSDNLATKDSLDNAKKIIQEFLESSHREKFHVLLKIISRISSRNRQLNKNVLFISTHNDLAEVYSYIECAYFLLPVIYRAQISLVMGYVQEDACTKADIVVSLRDKVPSSLPSSLGWLSSERKILTNLEESQKGLDLGYVQALQEFFLNEPDKTKITQLIDDLDDIHLYESLAGTTLSTLIDSPEQIISEIPSLSKNRDVILKKLGCHSEEFTPTLIGQIDEVCNLDLDNWESIELRLNRLVDSSRLKSVLKFFKLLFSERVQSLRENGELPILKSLGVESRDLRFSTAIECTQDTPDDWQSFKRLAKLAFSNSHKDYLAFIDSTLGCSDKWCTALSRPVLCEWMMIVAQETLLQDYFTREETFAWQYIFRKSPSSYIDEILENSEIKKENKKAIAHLIVNCLSKLDGDISELSKARTKVLSHIVNWEIDEAAELTSELVKTWDHERNISEDDWGILSNEIFLFPRRYVDSIADYFDNIKAPAIYSSHPEYRTYKNISFDSAHKAAQRLSNKDDTRTFLLNCQKGWLTSNSFLKIILGILESSQVEPAVIDEVVLQLFVIETDQNILSGEIENGESDLIKILVALVFNSESDISLKSGLCSRLLHIFLFESSRYEVFEGWEEDILRSRQMDELPILDRRKQSGYKQWVHLACQSFLKNQELRENFPKDSEEIQKAKIDSVITSLEKADLHYESRILKEVVRRQRNSVQSINQLSETKENAMRGTHSSTANKGVQTELSPSNEISSTGSYEPSDSFDVTQSVPKAEHEALKAKYEALKAKSEEFALNIKGSTESFLEEGVNNANSDTNDDKALDVALPSQKKN